MGEWIGIAAAAGVFGLFIVILVYSWWAEKKRKEGLAQRAEELGLDYFPDGRPDLAAQFSDFHLMNRGHSRRHSKVIAGETDEVRIAIFDYRFTTGSGKNRATFHQSVVSLQSPQLRIPTFHLRPESMMDKIGGMLGFQDIDFDSHPKFSRMFVLQGPDEAQIREFFDDELLTHFQKFQGYSIEGRPGALIMYRNGKRIKPDEIKEHLALAYEVFGILSDRLERDSNA